jgi:Lon protease-like protein
MNIVHNNTIEIPLFPLSAVLVPFGQMPLRIFERRYLDLVRDCMKSDSGFGVVWVRTGAEVASKGVADPQLGDYGTYARIIDWDQLDNGLLGITIQGSKTFDLDDVSLAASGLMMGKTRMHPDLVPSPVLPAWQPLVDVLQSLETHPHVQQMNLNIDYNNGWQVAYSLVHLLPLEESLKYELLGSENLDGLVRELDLILNQISGED